ncbi:MAG TPA: hypothetical protein VG603_06465 [Chitinophagales bacterium]|nr:hypothetical protein [Chitinophagales bacterium]
MFEYSKMKEELEQMKCPVHGKTATILVGDGKINIGDTCCNEHRETLLNKLPEVESTQDVADILEDVY